MAEDKLYEESNETLSDQLADAAGKIAAAGAAAVSFYRMGGARYLSKNYRRYEQEFRTLRNEIQSLDYAHVNEKSLREMLGRDGKIRRSWREFQPDDEAKIRIQARPGSLMELFGKSVQMEAEQESRRQAQIFNDRVTRRAVKMAQWRIRRTLGISEPVAQAFVQFAQVAAHNVREAGDKKKFALRDYINRHKALRSSPQLMDSILNDAIRFNEKFTAWRASHPDRGQGAAQAVVKHARELETWKRMNGSLHGKSRTNTILGDRPVTLGEYIDNLDRFSDESLIPFVDDNGNRKTLSVAAAMKNFLDGIAAQDKENGTELLKEYRDIYLDPYLRTDGKEFYSLAGVANLKSNAIKAAADTMPGKLLKLRSLDMSERMPSLIQFRAGTINPAIAALERKLTGRDHGQRIQHDYYYIAGRTYRYDASTDELSDEIKELRGFTPVSARFGPEANLTRDIFGLNGERYQPKGTVFRFLGLNSGQHNNIFESVKSFLSGEIDRTYVPNIIEQIQGNGARSLEDRYNSAVIVNEMLQSHVRAFSPSQLSALRSVYTEDALGADSIENKLFGLLEGSIKSDEDHLLQFMAEVSSEGDKSKAFMSERLSRLLTSFYRDPTKARTSVDLLEDISGSFAGGGKYGLDFREQLNAGLAEELVLRLAYRDPAAQDSYTAVKDIIESTDMSLGNEQKAKNFAYATLLEYQSHGRLHQSFRNMGSQSIGQSGLWQDEDDDILAAIAPMEHIIAGRGISAGAKDATKMVHDFSNDLHGPIHIKDRDTSFDTPSQYVEDDYILLHGASSPMDIIAGINDAIRENSIHPLKNVVTDIWSQLKAGREDAQNVSTLTMIPYFFLRRLGDMDVSGFLQFSNEELASTAGLAKGLAKRIGAAAVGETYLEWADDTVGAITGTRASAGIVNSLDYMDIGARMLLDATGIGGLLETQSYVNPIAQYWFGRDGYYDADEQRDLYANGYEPVRRGRYWAFGSVNEFRGSNVEYYEPTLTRRLNSDYYNKSLYDGYWDKWGHSLLPMPAAPLSPLVYMMDPYYLEEEHYYDRPYAVTGTMFDKDTPWGIVLNPTIGQLIKPVQRMHQEEMDGDGQDVRTIIYGINKHIRDTSSGQHAYAMVFDRERITAGEYTAYTNPSLGQYSIDIGKTKGQLMKEAQAEAINNGQPMELERRNFLYEPAGGNGDGDSGFAVGGRGTGGGGGSAAPLDMLGQTNRQIYAAAARYSNTGGLITTDRIRYSKIDDILTSDDMLQLEQEGTNADLLDQVSRSARLITGIYGYGANRAFGFGESDGREIATAADIDSFSRSFWDESIGGIGGGAAEIGRRFIPEFRRNIRVNPLLNNMPDWLPEYLRVGDPYAALPKGEARLPGEGYEALNRLHPDKYGIYGAYDRYKILADVAPTSAEFKVWRKLAQSTVRDPALKDEMRKIQERVNEQNKQHDFYPYRILGEGIKFEDVTISEVNNDGTFRVKGSDDLYTIAGIDFNAKHTSPNDYEAKAENQRLGKQVMEEYLHPGMSITVGLDRNEYHRRNGDDVQSINAAVFVDGESLAQTMLEEHPDAVQRKKDNLNAADTWAMSSTFHRALGGAAELIAHLDLPLLHDRWLRVRDPLESYNAEQVYGTPYQTWSDIWGTYVMPAVERSVSEHWNVIRSTAEFFALQAAHERQGIGRTQKFLLSASGMLMDRGAFITGTMAKILKPNDGAFLEGSKKAGALAMALGNLYTSTQSSTLEAAASWAEVGFMAGDVLDSSKLDFLKESSIVKKFFRDEKSMLYRSKFAVGGAVLGAAARGMFGPSIEGGGREHWTPERVQKKWEMEDYFDRLTYIKNMALYHKAAALAESREGINMEKIFSDYDDWAEKRREIMEESDVNNDSIWLATKRRLSRLFLDGPDENNHRFEYSNGFSINDLPGVRNGVFHSEEISEEERLYTLNALVSMGIHYNKRGTNRTQDDRDMTQLRDFERVYHTDIPDYYQVHHIIEFSQNGADDPSNMIALNPDDHLYITEQQHKLAEGDFSAAEIGARTAMRIGEYGRAALLYKKAAEQTMYGLRADARWTDVEMALPRYERDYFQEFMKEKDPEKQEEILRSVSPFLRRALKQVWGMDYEGDKGPDNDEYFEAHNLPNFLWEGWRPDSDLNNIKAKTIKNEGMLFSDFGIYESKYRDPQVIHAPNLTPRGSNNALEVQAKLATILNGFGLTGVEVSVEPKSTRGTQSIINLLSVTEYDAKQKVNELFTGNI